MFSIPITGTYAVSGTAAAARQTAALRLTPIANTIPNRAAAIAASAAK